MRSTWFVVLVLAGVLLVLPGCQKRSAEAVVDEQIKIMNELAAALEAGQTTNAEEIKSRLEACGKKLQELNLSQEEQQKLMLAKQGDLMKAALRMQKAMMGQAGKLFGDMKGKLPSGFPGAMPSLPGSP